MTGKGLPSRAKPEALHSTCRILDENPVKRSDLYDQLEYDRRQIAASTDYGRELGFIEFVDEESQTPKIRLGGLGQPLHYADSMEESGVKNAFQRAISSYDPYRNGLLSIHEEGRVEESDGERWVSKDALTEEVNKFVEGSVESREINLLLKTAAAAGLGVRKVGRRGFPTRIVINSEFDNFVEELTDQYTLPTPVESTEEGGKEQRESVEDGSTNVDEETLEGGAKVTDTSPSHNVEGSTKSIIAKMRSSDLTLEIGIDISDKNDEEVLQIINQIESLG